MICSGKRIVFIHVSYNFLFIVIKLILRIEIIVWKQFENRYQYYTNK